MIKLKEYLDFASLAGELLKYKTLGKEKPFILTWSLTNRCNLDCSYCGLPGLTTPELSSEELFNYLDTAIKENLKVLSLTGGEPLVHKDFEKFVTKARSNGVLISVNSNGILVPKKIDFLKRNCFQVVISLDGIESTNDMYRGDGSFTKAVEALRLLKKEGIKTHACCVFTRDNYNRLNEILDFAKTIDVPFSFQPVAELKLTYEPYDKAMSKEQILEAVEFMINEKKKGNKYLKNSLTSLEYWKSLYTEDLIARCFAGKLFARVEVNGDLKKCGRVQEVIPYKELKNIGLAASFKKLKDFDECTSCEAWSAFNSNSVL